MNIEKSNEPEEIFSTVANTEICLETDSNSQLVRMPRTIEETGLGHILLEDLFSKQLFDKHVSTVRDLSISLGLAGPIVEELLNCLRADGRLEILGVHSADRHLNFKLTESGENFARQALDRSGYRGIAPVSASMLSQLIKSQSVKNHHVSRENVQSSFENVVIDDVLLSQLGAAMNSQKALFIHGDPGTGKTYISKRMSLLLGGAIFVPHAVVAGDSVVSVFDPVIHHAIEETENDQSLSYSDNVDPRLVRCQRPFVSSGGELDSRDLEIHYDASSRTYQAPLQLKASNGIYLIDDLGRQKISTAELLNRWIVPMESNEDVLTTESGYRLIVPFDLVLIFSTNLSPKELVDGAFLRRIGHKIKFGGLSEDAYIRIWKDECLARNIHFDKDHVDHLISNWYAPHGKDLLACHPRDLLSMAADFEQFYGNKNTVSETSLDLAWNSNFIVDHK